MAIEKAPQKLDSELVEREDEIIEASTRNAMANLNALYEALWDATAPDDSSQAFAGHDHAIGGGPISRGVSWAADSGDNTLYVYTPTTAKQKALIDSDGFRKYAGTARYYGSPLFTTGISSLIGRICYEAASSDFRLSFLETSGNLQSKQSQEVYLNLGQTGEGGAIWVDLPEIPLNPGKWNRLEMYAENETHDSATNPILTIYGIVIAEAPGHTRYRPGLLMSRLDGGLTGQPTNAGRAFSGFETLDEFLTRDEHWLDADVVSRLFWFCNAMWEGILDSGSPGTTTQAVRGHDHEDYGGLNITRNCVARFGMGFSQPWQLDVGAGEIGSTTPSTVSGLWLLADRDSGGAGAGVRTTAGVAHMLGPVGPGIVNTGTSTAPFLDAMVYVTASSISQTDYSIRVAVYNRDQPAFSAVGFINTPGGGGSLSGWVYIGEIPCVADSFNSFDIYLQCTKQPVSAFLQCVQISESADVAGLITSRVASAGATIQLGVAPGGNDGGDP